MKFSTCYECFNQIEFVNSMNRLIITFNRFKNKLSFITLIPCILLLITLVIITLIMVNPRLSALKKTIQVPKDNLFFQNWGLITGCCVIGLIIAARYKGRLKAETRAAECETNTCIQPNTNLGEIQSDSGQVNTRIWIYFIFFLLWSSLNSLFIGYLYGTFFYLGGTNVKAPPPMVSARAVEEEDDFRAN